MGTTIGEGPAAYVVDTSALPIVIVRYPAARPRDHFEALFEEYARLSRRHARLAYLIDFRDSDPAWMGADMRRLAAQCYARHVETLQRSTVCEARIVSSGVMRGVLTAFEWIKGDSAWPCATFTDELDARAWIGSQLAP